MPKSILTVLIPSTPALDNVLARHAKAMAKVDQELAKVNAKVNRVLK